MNGDGVVFCGNKTMSSFMFFFFNDTATTEIYTLSLHDALPISNNQNHRGEINLLFKILLESALHSDTEMCSPCVHSR